MSQVWIKLSQNLDLEAIGFYPASYNNETVDNFNIYELNSKPSPILYRADFTSVSLITMHTQ